MSFGDRICKLRKDKNITQAELAEKLFVTNKTISSWELDRTEPSIELIAELANVLDCSVSYLLLGVTSRNDVEVELKFKITEEEYKYFNDFMKVNAIYLNESKHCDVYYEPPYKKFVSNGNVNEFLRIGNRGNKKILTYKNKIKFFSCDEYEVEIDDEKNMHKIFCALGFEKLTEVRKLRKSYMYLEKYEVSLDCVENLGYFIELEVKNITKSTDKEYDELLIVCKNIGLDFNNIKKERYLQQML